MIQYAVAALIILAIVAGGFALLNRPKLVEVPETLPADFPETAFSHDLFEALLIEHVDSEGQIDYQRWHDSPDSVARLDSYLAAVSQFSPDNSPERFATKNDELAYWMYGYNAYVIKSVLYHWPVSSVTDIKAPLEAVKGLGFFYRLRFLFGGEAYSLLAVENRKIRKQYRDARIHFVLNCASESCPVMRPELPAGDELESLLASAAADFVGDPQNVSIDHDKRQVRLSRIFKWYKKDFINDLTRKGRPAELGLIDYVTSVAPEPLKSELDAAVDYEVAFHAYDWALNVQH